MLFFCLNKLLKITIFKKYIYNIKCEAKRDEVRERESLISHDRLHCAPLCVMITGADPKQEASTEGLNTGSRCNRGMRVSDKMWRVSIGLTYQARGPPGAGCVNKMNEMQVGVS